MNWKDRLESVGQDATFAMRQLRRAPGFALTTVVTLALGIGANATMFGIVDRLLLQPPAGVPDPARVVMARVEMGSAADRHGEARLSYPMYRDLKRVAGAFSEVGAYDGKTLTIGQGQTAEEIAGVGVTASYFRALGARPFLGRFFTDDETDNAPGAPVIVLGYGYWQRQLGGTPAVLGRTLSVGGTPYTVIGIAPANFNGLGLTDVAAWVPFTMSMTAKNFAEWSNTRGWYMLSIVARLRPGVTFESAVAQGSAGLQAGARSGGSSENDVAAANERLVLTSALPRDARGARPESKVALLVAAVSLLVLIIACANVANLQLARAMSRRREVAIRLALGVSRARLLRQLALDGLLLSLAGGAAALLVVVWGGEFVRRLLLGAASANASPVNWRVLLFTAAAAVATGVLTGLLPSLQSARSDLSTALRTGGRGVHGSFSRVRFALIGVQAALTIVLLVGTVLFVRSLRRIESVPLGMETGHVLLARVNSGGVLYSPEQRSRDYERLERAASALPGVEAAAAAYTAPFGASRNVEVLLPGRDTAALGPFYNAVSADFFTATGTRVIAGRSFTLADRSGSAPVAIVSQTAARRWWPSGSPIGKCIYIGGRDSVPCSQVVGVVEDTRRRDIIEDATPMVYAPLGQRQPWAAPFVMLIRTRAAAAGAARSVGQELRAAVPGVPFTSVRPLDEWINPQMQSWKLGATMFGLFAVLALVLAAVGLYGVMAYDVTQRTTEIGVRMALGARAADIGRLVVLRGARIAALGGVCGVAIALAAGGRVSSLLFRTSAYDPSAFALAIAVLGAVTVAATMVPALRAARVDPNASLRAD